MEQAIEHGSFRTFNVVDDFNRELLVIEVDLNLLTQRGTHA